MRQINELDILVDSPKLTKAQQQAYLKNADELGKQIHYIEDKLIKSVNNPY